MDWSQSYSSLWRVYRVNRKTWADDELIKNIDSVSISRTADGHLLESASVELTGELEADYYRVVLIAEQGGEVERVDVATLLFDANGGEYNHGTNIQKMDGYSVLYPASVTTIIDGEYAPAGVDGAAYAAELLQSAINAPVEVEGSFILNDHVVHEIGSSVLEAVWAVLNAGPDGGYVIQIDGKGIVHITPKPTVPSLAITMSDMGLLTNGITYSSDISEIPNRYIVIIDNYKVISANNDMNSSISTVNRGYCVDMVDESPTPINGETLNAYADRRLRDESVMIEERSYIRGFAPDVFLYSIVRATINGLEGDLRVDSQTINCSHGISVQEKVIKEIQLW